MANLSESIQLLVLPGKYVVCVHASERLEERGILEWRVTDGMSFATLALERPDDRPNPSIEVLQLLPDGTAIKLSGRM